MLLLLFLVAKPQSYQGILEYISTFSAVLPLILGLIFFKKFNHLLLRVILIYILYSFFNDLAILALQTTS
jgi:hypothetical protein